MQPMARERYEYDTKGRLEEAHTMDAFSKAVSLFHLFESVIISLSLSKGGVLRKLVFLCKHNISYGLDFASVEAFFETPKR